MAPTRPGEKRKRGRPPSSSAAVSRPTQTNVTSKRSKQQAKPVAVKKKPGRRSAAQPETTEATSVATPLVEQSSSGRKRKAEHLDTAEGEVEKHAAQNYSRLAHRVRKVPQETVTAKWKAPSQQVQDQVRELFTIATRSVILSRATVEERQEAEILLKQVARKLEKRVSRMLLPSDAKGLHFDLDQLRDRNTLLESQLTPANHALDLLKTEIKRAELELEDKKRNLADLETNLQSARNEQKKQDKPHPLLRLPKNFKMQGDGPEDIGLRPSTRADTTLFDRPDPELAPLLEQLRRSLESMQANHAQVQGVGDGVKQARVALDDVLFHRASSQQYDGV